MASLVVQWLRLHAPNAVSIGSTPSWGTRVWSNSWVVVYKLLVGSCGISKEEILKLQLGSLFIKVPVSLIEGWRTRIPFRSLGQQARWPINSCRPRLIVGGVNVAMTTESLVTKQKWELVQSPKTTSSKSVDMSMEKMGKVEEVRRVGEGCFGWVSPG